MVVDNNNADDINSVVILLQRRIDRLKLAIEQFNQQIKTVESIEDIRKIQLIV